MKRTENKKNTSASLRSDDKMLNFFAVSAGYIVHIPFTSAVQEPGYLDISR